MKKAVLSYLIGLSLICLGGQLLLGCETWELPTRKSQRNCVKPSGTLDAQIQQRKVDFSISGSSGTIDRVVWDFGNGSTTATTGMTVSYTYPTSSTYTVRATLSNACGSGSETVLSSKITVSDAVLPTVSLQPATDLSTNSATVGMTITSTGNATITQYGVCYSSTNTAPEVGKSDVLKSDKMGSVAINTPVSFVLTNLQPNTLYYVRSFAVNSSGKTGYSPDPVQTLRTGSTPSVNSTSASNIGVTTSSVNFVVTNAGSPAATEYGICYSSSASVPDVTNSTVIPVANPTVGMNTSVNLTNLKPGTKYYYRSYARLPSGLVIYSATTESFTTQVDTLAQDLIASVSFTDRSLLDISGNNNHAILVNSPTFTADHKGQPNSAILLNGSGDYFYMAENSSLRPDALSISIWIKPNAINNTTDRIQIYNKSRWDDSAFEMYSSLIKKNENGPGLTFMTDIKQNSQCQSGKQWQSFQFSSNPQLNAWHHLVFTYSGRSIRMYFDNVLVDQKDDLPANNMDKCLGGELKFGAQIKSLPNYFNGAMDDIRLYKRAITAGEVQTLYNQ